MGVLYSGPSGFQVAGNPPGASGFDYTTFDAGLNTLTPGYTGGVNTNNVLNVEGMTPDVRGLLGFTLQREQEAYKREQENWERIRQMRKEEAQEAYKMQLPFKIAGAVTDVFKNIQLAKQPYVQTEMNIRSNTAPLLANVYGNNPYAGRKWLS